MRSTLAAARMPFSAQAPRNVTSRSPARLCMIARTRGEPQARLLMIRVRPFLTRRSHAGVVASSSGPSSHQRELSFSHPHSASASPGTGQTHAHLLDRFWRARGVMDEALREGLVDAGLSAIRSKESGRAEADAVIEESGTSWVVASAGSTQVAAIGRRLADLAELMGAGRGYEDVDVVWMVLREPRLLTAELSQLRRMLVEMKVAKGCEGIDVAKICEAQPTLLLQDASEMDNEESFAQRMQAWKHGFVTDNDAEWSRRFGELQEYTKLHGDAHVGCRDGDDRELARWAKKQRAAFKGGELGEDRLNALQALQFEFSLEDAEWKRWHSELTTFFLIYGHSSPVPLSDLTNYYLINWCCVQRIARRNGVMPNSRIKMLDDIEFDWSGADPLS